jgi:membrane protein DedA with SNARE-associated domain
VLTAVATALGSAGLSTATQPELPGFLNALAGPLEHYGLWAILLLVLLEDFGIPVPGETVLIAGAIFAGSGRLNIVAVGIVGFCAAVVGDNIGYGIGRFGGRRIADRWGKYVFLTPERLDKAEVFFDRQGAKIITIARFIEGLRQANGLIAGIAQMHWLRFIAYNALGAALWVGTWVSIGYFAGQHITAIYDAITKYSLYVAIAAVVLIAAWIVHRIYKRRKSMTEAAQRAQATRHEAATGEQADAAAATDATGSIDATGSTDATAATESSEATVEPETTDKAAADQSRPAGRGARHPEG